MINKPKITLALLVILTVGLIYRLILMTLNFFPPGSDIGLHQSVINSLLSPHSSLFYNYYHMGGGISLTNPGYHIFASFIICMSGAPDFFVQALVASLFSALIILSSFLIVKLAWGEQIGLVAAILVTFSAGDLVMLSWGGYPNVIALSLIPLLFYLLFKPMNRLSVGYLAVEAILVGALFLTHIFSALVFVGIILVTLTFSFALRVVNFDYRRFITGLLVLLVGLLMVSPYIFHVLPIYFGSEGAITGAVSAVSQAVVETRETPLIFLAISLLPIALFFLYSKISRGKSVSFSAIFFSALILVPLAATQAHLFGIYLDYERFLYFLALPGITCLSLSIFYATKGIGRVLAKFKKDFSSQKLTKPLISIILVVSLFTPMFSLPNTAFSQLNFFQVMTQEKYDAINWVKENTPSDALFVADAGMGWWLSGFGQRRVWSAVDPQYLILEREIKPANIALNLLKNDYLINNGILEISQKGISASDSTHNIYSVSDSSIIHPIVFSLNDKEISLLYRDNRSPKELKLEQSRNPITRVIDSANDSSFWISRDFGSLFVNEVITLYRGMRFARVDFTFINQGSVNFDWLHIPFQARGYLVRQENGAAIIDSTALSASQIVFPNSNFGSDALISQNPDSYDIVYYLGGNSAATISFYVGLTPLQLYSPDGYTIEDYWNILLENSSETYLDKTVTKSIISFDYKVALQANDISYVVLTNIDSVTRFSEDSTFQLVFRNNEVEIFRVVN
jgi:hypothetical protein